MQVSMRMNMQVLGSKFFCLMLLVLVTCSGLAVVWSTNEARTMINHLLQLRTEANQMLVAHGQYLLQERSISSAAGLENVAMEKLGLRYPDSSDIQVLKP